MAVMQKFQQPVLDTFDPDKCLADKPYIKPFDFESCTLEDLKTVHLSFSHVMRKTAILHGYAMWFDAYFVGLD